MKTADWEALVAAITSHEPGDTISVTLTKGSSRRTIPVTLSTSDGTRAQMGIRGEFTNQRQSLPQAFKMSIGFVGQVFVAIAGFFNPNTFHESVQGSTGIIGIAVIASEQAQRGPIDFAFFIAALSLSLGVMNILPIPPLDGGKIVLEVVEVIRRRPLSRKITIGVSLAGTFVLVALIGYLMYADVIRFVIQSG